MLAWAGVRGAVSLAAALALPIDLPYRDTIVFVTFVVILGTLVGQVLTLPVLIRVLGVEDDDGADREDAKARIKAAEAALARLEELAAEEWVREDTVERMRGVVQLPHAPLPRPVRRSRRMTARRSARRPTSACGASCSTPSAVRCSSCATRAMITEEVMQRVQRDIDLEDSRLDV